jgi:DNA modification methylase
MERLGKHLDYYWPTAYLTPGDSAKLWQRKVMPKWKPVLTYTKGTYTGSGFTDVVQSDGNDKRYHHWGQSVSGMRGLMKDIVWPRHVVVDPFVGGGTTGVVALQLRAFFIGCDIAEQHINTSKVRLDEEAKKLDAVAAAE